MQLEKFFDSEKSGLKVRSLGPVYHPGRASTLPCVDGEARGLAGSAQPGPRLSPPSQLPTSEPHAELSGAAVRRRHWRGWQCGGRGIGGPEPTYCVLSFSVNHSVTTLHTLPPHGLVHLLYLDSMAQFTLFLFESRFSANISTADWRLQTTKSVNYRRDEEPCFHFMEWWRRKEYANQYANESNYSQQHLSNSYFLNGLQSFFKKLVFLFFLMFCSLHFHQITIIEVLSVPKIKRGFISSERPLHFIPKAW